MASDNPSSVFGDLDPLTEQDVPIVAEVQLPNDFAPTDSAQAVPDQASAVTDPLQNAMKEAQAWKEMALRAAAELDNFRKRTAKDRQEALRFANSALLESLLPIIDNFDFGLQAARAESESSTIFVGMSMVHKQLLDFLRDQGVEEIPAVGQPFDPNLHDAVSQQPNAEVPEGTVLAQIRRGFRLRERLLRPASVVVASSAN